MCIFLTQKLNNIVSKIETRKPYYENIEEWLHEMTELMLQNEQETILFFNKCKETEARIIYWLSPCFDDIACQFYSNDMIDAMTCLIEKYPEDDGLKRDVIIATNIIHNIQNNHSLK
jgi:hypothetical protein